MKRIEVSCGASLREAVRRDFLDLASLIHASLAAPSTLGVDRRAGAYLVRPYIEGADLTSALRGCRPEEVLPWLWASAEALAILHRSGFSHRNLKGSNLLVPREYLLRRRRHEPKVVLCDPAWWPEDALQSAGGSAEDTGRRADRPAQLTSDLASLGAVFYFILTGSSISTDRAILEGSAPAASTPRPPSDLNPEIPTDLERLILKLLQTARGRGYEGIGAVIEDLQRLQRPRRPPQGASGRSPVVTPECFVGRSREMDQAVSLWRDPRRPTAIAIGGESGIGKSSLLRRLELEAQVRGMRTASARCYPEFGESYSPVRVLLNQLLASSDRARSNRSPWGELLREASATKVACGPSAEREDPRERRLLDLLRQASTPRPVLLLLDDVHFADPRSIRLLGKLVEEVAAGGRADLTEERSLPSLAVTFRSEASFRSALGPLLAPLRLPAPGLLLQELPPLQPEAVEKWQQGVLAEDGGFRERVKAAISGSRHPYTISEAIRTVTGAGETARAPRKHLSSFHEGYFGSLSAMAQHVLRTLAVLGRPAPADLLAALSAVPLAELRFLLAAVMGDGTLGEKDGAFYFRHETFRAWLLDGTSPEAARRLHRDIAAGLERSGRAPEEETAHHWLHSDVPRRGMRGALAAARRLARVREDHRAVVLYEALLDLVPAGRSPRRRVIAAELAEAYARSGDPRRAANVLEPLLAAAGSEPEAGILYGRMGVFLHRAGEISLAIPHLEKALGLLEKSRGEAPRLQRLRSASELAEILCNRGAYAQAETMCLNGLREIPAGRSRADPRVRREEMILVETLAHLKLRRLEHREARELFERSLRISEEIDSGPDTGLILNNLGILHMQENRFPEAIGCFLRARKLSEPLGEAGVLVNIESNLALLYARTGRPEEADGALAMAAQREVRCESDRIRFLRLHGAGVVNLLLGRFPAAIDALKEAVPLGKRLGDVSMVAFDAIHLGECHLFQGETVPARAAFRRALSLGSSAPAPVRAMAEARLAALAALGGDDRRARAALEAVHRGSEKSIPYVDAWNRFFCGWASRLLGRLAESEEALEAARSFFSMAEVSMGEVHAELELAAVELDRGSLVRARGRLAALSQRHPPGQGVLKNPMLAARLLAYRARLSFEEDPKNARAAASFLAQAESYLIGRKLRDVEKLVRILKKRLASLGEAGSERILDRDATEQPPGEPSSAEDGVRAGWILGSAPSIRKVRSQVLQVAPTKLAVLITGDTGTGKELVARAIHGESPRRHKPFLSVNCAALPGELLEAELFGYRRGAFSGAERDHAGLLASAHEGTFLFDAVAEFPFGLQAKLLRILDRGSVRPLGEVQEMEIDVRFLFTSNRDLRALVDEGKFRQDLFYRLCTFEVRLPPLRQRVSDIPLLLTRFQEEAGRGREPMRFDPGAVEALAAYSWPGNVRELENLTRRLALTAERRVRAEDVGALLGQSNGGGPFPAEFLSGKSLTELQDLLERSYLLQLHADRAGDLRAMARSLGIKLRALYKRFTRLGIDIKDLRER